MVLSPPHFDERACSFHYQWWLCETQELEQNKESRALSFSAFHGSWENRTQWALHECLPLLCLHDCFAAGTELQSYLDYAKVYRAISVRIWRPEAVVKHWLSRFLCGPRAALLGCFSSVQRVPSVFTSWSCLTIFTSPSTRWWKALLKWADWGTS